MAARTRFYIGQRSPRYYLTAAQQLAAVMPDASIEAIPRLGHDAVARAPVDSLHQFLAAA